MLMRSLVHTQQPSQLIFPPVVLHINYQHSTQCTLSSPETVSSFSRIKFLLPSSLSALWMVNREIGERYAKDRDLPLSNEIICNWVSGDSIVLSPPLSGLSNERCLLERLFKRLLFQFTGEHFHSPSPATVQHETIESAVHLIFQSPAQWNAGNLHTNESTVSLWNNEQTRASSSLSSNHIMEW